MDIYKILFRQFVEIGHKHGIQTVHLTTPDHEGWGDETIRYDLDARTPMYSREVAFLRYLTEAEEGCYWFTEPDARIVKMFPPLKADAAFLYRDHDVPMTPSFRLVTKKAVPFFEAVLGLYTGRKDWHGDSEAWLKLHQLLGSPKIGLHEWSGIRYEMRDYNDYTTRTGTYVHHYKFRSKEDLL